MENMASNLVPQQKNKTFFWLRLFSTIIDLSLISAMSTILQWIILQFLFVPYQLLWMIVLMLYYFVSYLKLEGYTIGRSFTGLQLLSKDSQPLGIGSILVREFVFKFCFLLLVPLLLSEYGFAKQTIIIELILYFLMMTFSLFFLLISQKPWWERFSSTKTIRKNVAIDFPLKKLFLAYTGLIVLAIVLVLAPFGFQIERMYNLYRPVYPKTSETIQMGKYVQTHAKDPVDYVFDLFDKYDIVVISERMHPEYTQYDLYSKMVADPRFAERVGNIFTETGSVSFQDTVNNLLRTKYASEDSLDKYTALLQRNSNGVWPLWDNTNMFDMLKRVNHLNAAMTDTTKMLHWYFTDLPVDWGKMTKETQQNAYHDKRRDSLEASVVINVYQQLISRQKRKKSLVIMNTRHGYGHIDQRFPQSIQDEFHGTTAYLQEALPGKVANVMLHTVTQKYAYMFSPTQNGKWDRVFEDIGNPDAGFDFGGSPFGNDKFDVAFIASRGLMFKDVFTGYIFYKPLRAHLKKEGFPYEFNQFEDTMIRRASILSEDYVAVIKARIAFLKAHPGDSVHTDDPYKYALLYNGYQVGWGLVKLLLSFLIAVFFYRRSISLVQ